MNPYFQNQQFGYQNVAGYYGYNQTSFQGYGYTSPAQSIEAMYTTVHPYNSKQFLLSTFGNKTQYIEFFLTLSHQDKLKMYMLMEQKKLYGEMSDKQSYQKILKQIAQKIQNFNLFHQAKSQKKIAEDKSKQLESKIDFIVEKTFEKLNFPQSQSKGKPQSRTEEIVLDQDQWVQSTETNQPQALVSRNSTPTSINQLSTSQSIQEKKREQEAKNKVFNMFTFDSNMYEAFTHQIGLKTVQELQKKSIWQLQVEESQIRDEEPNLKQIFKIKETAQQKMQASNLKSLTSKHNQNTILPSMNNPQQTKHQFSGGPINSTEFYDLYRKNSTVNQTQLKQSIREENEVSMQDFNSFVESRPQQPQDIEVNALTNNILPDDQYSASFQVKPSFNTSQLLQSMYKSQTNTFQNNELQFNSRNLAKELTIIQQNQLKTQIKNIQPKQEKVEKDFDYENLLFDSVQIQTPSVSSDFDFLNAFTQPSNKPQINVQISTFPDYFHQNQPQQAVGQVLFQSQHLSQNIATKIQQMPKLALDSGVQTPPLDLIRSSLGSLAWQNQELLKKLKVQLSQSDKLTIQKGLKNKSFQCNIEFYSVIINFLRQVSLEWSPQYRHFTEQYKIVKQLHQQTQRYSKAVDQDEQQKVAASIKITKRLLNDIYQNSTKTEKYVINLVDQKSEEKGYLYKFGRILLSSSLNTQIFQKVTKQQNKQILKSFYVFYVIEKISSIIKLKNFSEKLMIYLGQQYQKHKGLDNQKLDEIQNKEQSYPKYIVYIKGLVKLCNICERMITLLKLCCLKTQSNTVKMVKMCKDIKIKYSKYDEADNNSANHLEALQQTIRASIQKNKSVYDLHNNFFDCYKEAPVCALCLKLIKKDGSKVEQIYYHYSCFNLSLQLQKQIELFTQ